MISQLTIRNFGLFDQLSVEFSRRLNIFTGETGAGKTILIDALRFCLGERLNSSQVRDADKPAVIEVVFELSKSQLRESPVFSEYIPDNESLLVINRRYLPDGRSKNRINGFTVTVSQLKEVGNHLIDFHGPHDHQMLLSQDSHITILDRLCGLEEEKSAYIRKYNTYCEIERKLQELRTLSENREREQDMLKYQIKELEQVSLDSVKYEELLQERTRVNNVEKLYEYARQLADMLENEERGISSVTAEAFLPLQALNNIDESTREFTDILKRIQEDSSELLSALNRYLEELSFQPEEADEINRRYDAYYEVMRKYGPTLEDARRFYEEAKERYGLLINLEDSDARLQERIKGAGKEARAVARKISAKRQRGARSLEETIERELKELGILAVRFECRVASGELNPAGQDEVAFYISPNVGEDLKPLGEIVSSGEAARVMLALKKALTRVDPIPVLIFDEIDAQIGGRLGAVTGKKLKELAQERQVILITHLPQIASFGDSHFKVAKQVRDKRTLIKVNLLDKQARVKELAKMMSGEKESRIALTHAHDMLRHAKK